MEVGGQYMTLLYNKSIIVKATLLEFIANSYVIEPFLRSRFFDLPQDAQACYLALCNREKVSLPVGNCRSLLIGLKYLIQEDKIPVYNLVMGEQLKKRKLDKNSSQWSSIKVLCGEKVRDNRYHVNLARRVKDVWDNGDLDKLLMEDDHTLKNQIKYALDLNFRIKNLRLFEYDNLKNPEDAPFAVVFDQITIKQALKKFPTLRHHESNRVKELRKSIYQYENEELVTTDDHRIVMAIALYEKFKRSGKPNHLFAHPECVAKSCPKFWGILNGQN